VTVKLFESDPYLKTFRARVVSWDGPSVVLDRTCFYAESGGQPGDTGLIAGMPVLGAAYGADGQSILHRMSTGCTLEPGAEVDGAIDWNRRYRTMRLHSALHICHFAFSALYGSHRIRGSNIDEDKARIDYEFFDTIDGATIAEGINGLVNADLPIERSFDGDRGLWRIEGYDPIPCGGTHPRRTSEIGLVECTVKRKGSQGQRIYVSLCE
jgi:Ser-tRNA(Ala) deacylase AlaX